MRRFGRKKTPKVSPNRRMLLRDMKNALKDRDNRYSVDAYRKVFENTHDMVVMLNSVQEIIDLNRKASELLGLSAQELIGKRFMDFVRETGGEEGSGGTSLGALIANAAQGHKEGIKTRINVRIGQLPVDITALPLRMGDGKNGILLILKDFTEEEKSETSLKQAVSYLQNIFYHSPDPMFMVALDGNIVEHNDAAANLTGRSSDDAEGSPFLALFPSKAEVRELLEQAMNIPVQNVESVLRPVGNVHGTTGTMSGSTGILSGTPGALSVKVRDIPVNLSAALISNEEEKPIGHVVVCHDMTLQKEAQDKIRRQNIDLKKQTARAMEANRLKSEFLANMSHELRTPLNAVLALSQVMLDEPAEALSESHRKKLSVIMSSGETLLHLLNSILDLAKIEAGRMEIMPEPVNLKFMAHGVAETITPLAEEKSLSIYEEYSPDLPETVYTDEGKLQQVLLNIAGNAVKFTEVGGVNITVEKLPGYNFPDRALANRPAVAISIVDTGIGISSDHLKDIFQEFRQVDGTTTRKYGGTGLGLAISQKLIIMLRGIIEVGSSPGKGTVFRVLLPVFESAEEWENQGQDEEWKDEQRSDRIRIISISGSVDRRPHSALVRRTMGHAPRGAEGKYAGGPEERTRPVVLVVDDKESNRFVVRALLETSDVKILEAKDGKEAIEKANKFRPDIILMDIMMPGMDGMEATRRLKRSALSGIPVIALTAKAMKEDKKAAMDAGFDDYIPKPVEKNRFMTVMDKWMKVNR